MSIKQSPQFLELPQRILNHVKKTAKSGNVESVISEIDNYCYNVERAMNVGDVKGKILDSLVIEANPTNVLELGTYCGYSALRMSRLLKSDATLFTVEMNPTNANVATEMIKFAGMDHKIKVLVGRSDNILPSIASSCGISSFDFVFLDHFKDRYKPDLILLEELQLMSNGTVIVADNCIFPGCPDYLEYVRNNSKYKCKSYLSKLEYSERDDSMEKSIYIK